MNGLWATTPALASASRGAAAGWLGGSDTDEEAAGISDDAVVMGAVVAGPTPAGTAGEVISVEDAVVAEDAVVTEAVGSAVIDAADNRAGAGAALASGVVGGEGCVQGSAMNGFWAVAFEPEEVDRHPAAASSSAATSKPNRKEPCRVTAIVMPRQ